MKKKLTVQEYVVVASMLFGLFFGAGNLIFPVHMGQMAGSQLVPATLGFLITGVGLPLLSVAALGISKSEGLFDLSRKVSRPYAYFFTCLLYLTIGPFFAIPRCATTASPSASSRQCRRRRSGCGCGCWFFQPCSLLQRFCFRSSPAKF